MLLKAARKVIDPKPSGEQRNCPRAKAAISLEAVRLDKPGKPVVSIRCHDISGKGLGFSSPYDFRLNERFVVRFHFANVHDRLVLCRVRHCTALSAQRYKGGVEFVDAVTAQAGNADMPAHWTDKPILP